jgi:NADPH:quinone reductase-like Zn-dependent oxidoreductase
VKAQRPGKVHHLRQGRFGFGDETAHDLGHRQDFRAGLLLAYATAWTCLFRNLEIQKGQLLVIRAATSSFGQAAFTLPRCFLRERSC